MAKPLAWLLVALVVTTALVLTSRGPHTPPPRPLPDHRTCEPDRDAVAVDAPLPVARTTPAGLPPLPALREPAIAARAAGGGASHVSGTIHVLEARDQYVPRAGMIVFAGEKRGALPWSRLRAPVVNGTWQLELPGEFSLLTMLEIVLDGRLAHCEQRIAVQRLRGPAALQAHWIEAHVVRVFDASTGVELDGLTVVQSRDPQATDLAHPGLFPRIVRADARSPLCLPTSAMREAGRLWVRAPAHAWNHVTIGGDVPGERALSLRPGGDLDVELAGIDSLPAGAWLCARPLGSDHDAVRVAPHDQRGPMRLGGLEAGSWALTLEQRRFATGPGTVLGSAIAAVAPGAESRARITVTPPREPAKTTLAGTLRCDDAWGGKVSLCLAATGEAAAWTRQMVMLDVAGMGLQADGTRLFGPIPLHTGRYELVVRPCGHAQVVDVGPGASRVDVVVPAPYVGTVHVRDADDRPVTDARVSWSRAVDGVRPGLLRTAARPRGDGSYELRAPAGPLTVAVAHDDFADAARDLAMTPGGATVTLRLLRAFGVDLVLKDGEAVVPPASLTLEHVASRSRTTVHQQDRVPAALPGPHALTIGPIDGFLPVPPQHVDLTPGTWTRVEVALRRSR